MPNEFSNEYIQSQGAQGGSAGFNAIIGELYTQPDGNWPAPPAITDPQSGESIQYAGSRAGAKPSIFNRYSIFFFNNRTSNSTTPEDYFDKPEKYGIRAQNDMATTVISHPSATNIIKWSKTGQTNAVEYDWPDFTWCKHYGDVPNNYMVTLRRFPMPCADDLFDNSKNPAPDIGRMITWVDNSMNSFESVGMKFSHGMTWKKLTADIQEVEYQGAYQNEGLGLQNDYAGGGYKGTIARSANTVGKAIVAASAATQEGFGKNNLANPNMDTYNPYGENRNVTFGPVDIIREMYIREKGLEFTQEFSLKFEYELRSIDGINPKVAFMDLLSNILICTANKGSFWGGEVRHYGGYARKVKPLGDPSMLEKGNFQGYVKSILQKLMGRLSSLTDGQGFSLAGLGNAAKTIGSNILGNVLGGSLDNMGRPQIHGLNALLTGEDTGEWHVTVGNPANPMISVGNLILESTDIAFDGSLGIDDFPSRMIVECKLKPARPRDRNDIMAMFSRHGRMYITDPPTASKYAGVLEKGGLNPHASNDISGAGADKGKYFNEDSLKQIRESGVASRFPNHMKDPGLLTQAARGID
jgi:hypothetical protein